jgi:MFS superfamily sulfate permease-like transporter
MNDQYSISETTETSRGVLRPLLWLGLILSAVANAIFSSFGGSPFVGSAFGAVALACAVTLIVHHNRTRAH